MTSAEDPSSWHGRDVVDRGGEKIGSVDTVYLHRETDEPQWVSVKTGVLGHRHLLVPLAGASISEDDLQVAFDRDTVKDAPSVGDDLSPADKDELSRYYGMQPGMASPSGQAAAGERGGAVADGSQRSDGPSSEAATAGGAAAEGQPEDAAESEPARTRKQTVTEHLSERGEVLKRETHTEEERPDSA
jgi:hypothetical protein